MHMGALLWIHTCVSHACNALRRQKRTLDSLILEVHMMVVNHQQVLETDKDPLIE